MFLSWMDSLLIFMYSLLVLPLLMLSSFLDDFLIVDFGSLPFYYYPDEGCEAIDLFSW